MNSIGSPWWPSPWKSGFMIGASTLLLLVYVSHPRQAEILISSSSANSNQNKKRKFTPCIFCWRWMLMESSRSSLGRWWRSRPCSHRVWSHRFGSQAYWDNVFGNEGNDAGRMRPRYWEYPGWHETGIPWLYRPKRGCGRCIMDCMVDIDIKF